MNHDEIVEGIRAICAPLPDCRDLRDKIIEAVETRSEALSLASVAFAQYALGADSPPLDAVRDFEEGFVQDAQLRRVASRFR